MSEFWLRKMKTYFNRIDFDKDGAITRKDFEGMAQRFVDSGKIAPEQKEQLSQTLTAVWDKYLSAVGGGDCLSQEVFIQSMTKLVKDTSLKSTLEGPLPLFFHAVDSNDDKMISGEEFQQFFGILGLDPSLAPASFAAIDENGDGQISEEEFVHAGSDFFLEQNDESKPSKLFWGPLL